LKRDFFDSFNGRFQRRAGDLAEKTKKTNPPSGLNPLGWDNAPARPLQTMLGIFLTAQISCRFIDLSKHQVSARLHQVPMMATYVPTLLVELSNQDFLSGLTKSRR